MMRENLNVVENVFSVTVIDAQPGDKLRYYCVLLYHICPNKDRFTTKQAINSGTVLLRNNVPFTDQDA